MRELFLKADDLAVGYEGKVLIQEISLELKRGQIVTLIGPNGSGKSTILKTLTRLIPALGGKIWIEGRESSKLSLKEMARQVAVLLPERLRTELITCREVVSAGRTPYTGTFGILSDSDKHIVADAMQRMNVLELAERDFTAISDGQRQRVQLARAIAQEADLIILDEPTSYLDIRYQAELLDLLRNLANERQTAVLMSLHELEWAQKISDWVLCVKGDVIRHYGRPHEIFRPEIITELYGLPEDSYDVMAGSLELRPPQGRADLFVVAGQGTGMPVFRALQRQGRPFVCGVLHANDADLFTARALAEKCVIEEAFEEISEKSLKEALTLLGECKELILCLSHFGTMNKRNAELVQVAEQRGLKIWPSAEAWLLQGNSEVEP